MYRKPQLVIGSSNQKMIYCMVCGTHAQLFVNRHSFCECRESHGRLRPDGVVAEVWGPCIEWGYNVAEFMHAIKTRPAYGKGSVFTSFVISRKCVTIRRDAPYEPKHEEAEESSEEASDRKLA